ncbi:MAG TPA: hypothetical protein VD902_11445 [Symbiobacteriaceae bacterium]|nr:hypothetical protein [Symbiobacteriaceae bacterium]
MSTIIPSVDLGTAGTTRGARVAPTGVQRVLDLLDADLSHIALDSGATTDAGLAAEHYRAALTPPFRDGATTVLEVYLDETQGNGLTETVALLAGATGTPGTGTLFAYQGAAIEKTDRDSLTISFEVTVEGVA